MRIKYILRISSGLKCSYFKTQPHLLISWSKPQIMLLLFTISSCLLSKATHKISVGVVVAACSCQGNLFLSCAGRPCDCPRPHSESVTESSRKGHQEDNHQAGEDSTPEAAAPGGDAHPRARTRRVEHPENSQQANLSSRERFLHPRFV